MSERTICHGCGQRIELPEGYRRNKIQCPECGVITPVDPAGRKAVPADDTPFDTRGGPSQGNLLPHRAVPEPEPDIASLPDTPPAREPAVPPAEPSVWTCQHCGEWQLRKPQGRKARCPVCKTPVPAEPRPVRADAVAVAPLAKGGPRPAVQQHEWSDNPDDSKPYRVDATEPLACKGCGKPMEPEAILCVHCGLDIRSGVKQRTVYDPIKKRWDAGLALPLRLVCFAGWQCLALPPTVWGAAHEGHAFYAIGIWIWLSLMAAFLCGTYDRIDLERNARGKVKLVKTWHLCFVPCPPVDINLAEYEGIVTGQVMDRDFSDYVVLLSLTGFGLLPGLVWYFGFMQRETWFVALTKDHGHPEMSIYRGWSDHRAKQIASTLRTAALPAYPWY